MRTKESIRIELIKLSHDVQDPNKPQYREFERRGEGVPYERGYTAGFQEGMDMAMKEMDEWAKERAIDFWRWTLKKEYKLTLAAHQIFELYLQETSFLNSK